MDDQGPPLPLRYADHVIVRGSGSKKERQTAREKLMAPLPDCYQVANCELRKNEFEIKAIAHIAASTDQTVKKLGLSSRNIHPERIHILHKDDYRRILGGRDDARTVLGHTYITRTNDMIAMLFMLTHELAHLASYLSLLVRLGPNAGHVSWKRNGYMIQRNDKNLLFTGLNEACAELLAGLIRRMLLMYTGLITPEEHKELKSGYIYSAQVRVVTTFIDLINERKGYVNDEALVELIRGYLTGELNFMRMANQVMPKSIPILRTMSAEPESALIAAYALGQKDVYLDIKKYLRSMDHVEF
jgi:hypothetical protein